MSWANALNLHGDTAGASTTLGPSAPRAFLCSADGCMIDLNSLLRPGSPWVLFEAREIDDNGTIRGLGRLSDVESYFELERSVPATVRQILSDADGADFDLDRSTTAQDLSEYVTAFLAAEPRADFNRDGRIDSTDFHDFLAAFFSSTP